MIYRTISLLLLAAIMGGCTIAKISGRGSIPLLLNNPTERVEAIEHFKESKLVVFDYTSSFDVSQILAKRLQGSDADAVTNLVIVLKSTPVSFMVNVFSLGFASAKVFSAEGDLVKIKGGIGMEDLPDGYELAATFERFDELRLNAEGLENSSFVRLREGGFAYLKK